MRDLLEWADQRRPNVRMPGEPRRRGVRVILLPSGRGATAPIIMSGVLGLIMAFIAYGRMFLSPIN